LLTFEWSQKNRKGCSLAWLVTRLKSWYVYFGESPFSKIGSLARYMIFENNSNVFLLIIYASVENRDSRDQSAVNMPNRTSASPSPPPQAPTPGVPGPRATALQKVFAGALSSSLKANSYPNFSACFPTPAKYCPSALEGVWKQLNTRLEEECLKDFEKILEERSVIEGLNQWDTLVEDARRRKNRAVEGESPGRP
jgi:Nnf1